MNSKAVIVIAIVLLLLLSVPQKHIYNDVATPATDTDIEIVLAGILATYERVIAEQVEKIFRLETSHYMSGGFKRTNAAGMTAFSATFPYGWNQLANFWNTSQNPSTKPSGVVTLIENGTGKQLDFVVFPDLNAAMETLAYWLQSNRPGKWFSNDLSQQLVYEAKLATIKAKFIDSLS